MWVEHAHSSTHSRLSVQSLQSRDPPLGLLHHNFLRRSPVLEVGGGSRSGPEPVSGPHEGLEEETHRQTEQQQQRTGAAPAAHEEAPHHLLITVITDGPTSALLVPVRSEPDSVRPSVDSGFKSKQLWQVTCWNAPLGPPPVPCSVRSAMVARAFSGLCDVSLWILQS